MYCLTQLCSISDLASHVCRSAAVSKTASTCNAYISPEAPGKSPCQAVFACSSGESLLQTGLNTIELNPLPIQLPTPTWLSVLNTICHNLFCGPCSLSELPGDGAVSVQLGRFPAIRDQHDTLVPTVDNQMRLLGLSRAHHGEW